MSKRWKSFVVIAVFAATGLTYAQGPLFDMLKISDAPLRAALVYISN